MLAQEREVRLTDHHIVGRGVVVQLLMPFLDEVAGRLLETIAVHDVQNLIAHALPLAAAPQRREHLPRPEARTDQRDAGPTSPDAGQPRRQTILGMAQFARLGVVAPLPIELADGAEAQPGEQQRQRILVVLRLAQQIVTQIEAMHQRPRAGSLLGADDLLGEIGQLSARRAGRPARSRTAAKRDRCRRS